jgi:pantoate--beta-alanine ligase
MPLEVHKTIDAMRQSLRKSHSSGTPVILVPTMGALHSGHQALIQRAIDLADQPLRGADTVGCQTNSALSDPVPRIIVSIFVNPLQFGPNEDFERYPRNLDRDIEFAAAAGATDIFAPAAAEFSPEKITTAVDPGALAEKLCGPFRPGHFRGVCTIVLKLFNVVQPTHAVFGWKDAQQLILLRKMVRDFNLAIGMIGVDTVREADGLALSSRNTYLTAEQRLVAPALQRTLQETREALLCGALVPPDVEAFARERLKVVGITQVDYFDLVSAEDLGSPRPDESWLLAAAIHLGNTRLIDNLRFSIR